MLSIFKKKGIKPTYTPEGMLYHLSKMESSFFGRFNEEVDTNLSFLIGQSEVSLKGYAPNGKYVNETYYTIGSPEYDSSTGYTWNFVGVNGELHFAYSINDLRGGNGIVIKVPDSPPGSFFFYR